MIFWRLVFVAGTVVIAATAWGALDMHRQPSAQRLVITAIAAIAAPLFWPGAGSGELRTSLRIVAWAVGTAIVALLLLLAFGRGRQSLSAASTACAMLAGIVAISCAAAAALEAWWCRHALDASNGSAIAGTVAAVLVALVGALPLWLGPTAELASATQPWLVDAVVATSPLTHLALAGGNDLLRNEWLYDHSNLAKLAVSYPALRAIAVWYVFVLFALAVIPLAQRSLRRRSHDAYPPCSTPEDVT